MTYVRVQYMVPKDNKPVGPMEFNHELSTRYPYQIVEYDTEAYSFNGEDLKDPINYTFQTVFGPKPFEIISSEPTQHVEHYIQHESVWGVQLDDIKPDPSLHYDMDMIVYLNRSFVGKLSNPITSN